MVTHAEISARTNGLLHPIPTIYLYHSLSLTTNCVEYRITDLRDKHNVVLEYYDDGSDSAQYKRICLDEDCKHSDCDSYTLTKPKLVVTAENGIPKAQADFIRLLIAGIVHKANA